MNPQNGNFHFIYGSWLIGRNEDEALKEFRKSLLLFHEGFSVKDVLERCYPRVKVYDKLRELVPSDSGDIWEFAAFLWRNGEKEMLEKLEMELESSGMVKPLEKIRKLKGE